MKNAQRDLRVWKQEMSLFFNILVFYEQLKFHAQLSWAWKKFYNLWTWIDKKSEDNQTLKCYVHF